MTETAVTATIAGTGLKEAAGSPGDSQPPCGALVSGVVWRTWVLSRWEPKSLFSGFLDDPYMSRSSPGDKRCSPGPPGFSLTKGASPRFPLVVTGPPLASPGGARAPAHVMTSVPQVEGLCSRGRAGSGRAGHT